MFTSFLILTMICTISAALIISDIYDGYKVKEALEDHQLKKIWDIIKKDMKEGMRWESVPARYSYDGWDVRSLANPNIPGVIITSRSTKCDIRTVKDIDIYVGHVNMKTMANKQYIIALCYPVIEKWMEKEKDSQK
jgi:L-serine deaminase